MSASDSPIFPEFRRPESVLVVVYTDDGQALLLRRRQPFDFWQSVTGSLLARETHAQAAARELEEETGFTQEGELTFSGKHRVFMIDPRWRNRYPAGVTINTEYEWRYRMPGIRDVTLDEAEHSAYRWLPFAEAIEAVWSWTNREALRELEERL